MPSVEPHGRQLFINICKEFANLKLLVCDEGKKESVQIYFPKSMADRFNYKDQVATVQYMGGPKVKPDGYTTIEIRFYKNAFQSAGVWDVFEKNTLYQKYKSNGKNPYVHYNVVDAFKFDKYIRVVFKDLELKFKESLGQSYDSLPIPEVPESLKELPRA